MGNQPVTYPVAFDGTAGEIRDNKKTHNWGARDDEGRECSECACREWHTAADYPCGVEPPRRTMTTKPKLTVLIHLSDGEVFGSAVIEGSIPVKLVIVDYLEEQDEPSFNVAIPQIGLASSEKALVSVMYADVATGRNITTDWFRNYKEKK